MQNISTRLLGLSRRDLLGKPQRKACLKGYQQHYRHINAVHDRCVFPQQCEQSQMQWVEYAQFFLVGTKPRVGKPRMGSGSGFGGPGGGFFLYSGLSNGFASTVATITKPPPRPPEPLPEPTRGLPTRGVSPDRFSGIVSCHCVRHIKSSGGALVESSLKVFGRSPGRIILESLRAEPGSNHPWKSSGGAWVESSLKVFGRSPGRIILESFRAEPGSNNPKSVRAEPGSNYPWKCSVGARVELASQLSSFLFGVDAGVILQFAP